MTGVNCRLIKSSRYSIDTHGSILAFTCASPLILSTQSSTFLGNKRSCCRRQRAPALKNARQSRQLQGSPRASLAIELLFKAVQVAAATALSNTVVTTTGRHTGTSSDTSGDRQPLPASLLDVPTWDILVKEARTLTERLTKVSDDVAGANRKWSKLAICIIIDLVGSGGLGLPLLSDLLDIITAPVTAVMLHALFASPLVTVAGFMEEILPGTDGIPTATLAWLAENTGYLDRLSSTNHKLDD